MRKPGAAIIAVTFVLALCPITRAEMIWSDSFESGDFSAWTSVNGNWDTSGGNIHSGSKRAQIAGPYEPDEDILLSAVSTAGFKDITLEYWYRIYAGLEENDFAYVEWMANGTDWQVLAVYNNIASNASWQKAGFSLPNGAWDNPLFQFRIRSALNNTSDCIYFDDIVLSGNPIPEPSSIITLAPFLFSLILRRSKKTT